ncbi:MAG TPA: metallophosphoesterase [Saprospiraceae bacterium]|nr:metallophosphoesterase [Saprospiraceae bacterium]
METNQFCIITDIHIPEPGKLAMNVDSRSHFINIVNRVVTDQPDYIVICGDLCFRDPSIEVYQWVKSILDQTYIPYFVIAGNHDHSGMMAEIFNLDKNYNTETGELYYKADLNGISALFLDTGKGYMSDRQFEWIKVELKMDLDCKILFMHHPPLFGGVSHMDKRYAFTQNDRFMTLISSFDRNFRLFTGHYHVEKTIFLHNVECFITPSCFVQIDYRFDEFQPEHYMPSFRNVWIDDGYFSTSVHYLQ